MKSLLDTMFPSNIDAITPMVRGEREAMYHEEKAKADRRRGLLRQWNDKRVEKGRYCPFCFVAPIPVMKPTDDTVVCHYEDSHTADGCELEEEVK